MEEPIGTWAFNEYSEEYSIERATERLVEGGHGGVVEGLFTEAAEEIDAVTDTQEGYVESFNDTTISWNHEPRARFAGFLAEREPIDMPDPFLDELINFARTAGYGPDGDEPAIPDDFEENADDLENPFEDDDLTDEEARAYVIVWANGGDPEEIDFGEVSDVSDFRWWIEKTGDLEDSLRAHHFGRDVSIDVIRHALPPDEWEQLDPDNIRQRECTSCREVFSEIETPDGPASVTTSGTIQRGLGVDSEDEDTVIIDSDIYVCPDCFSANMDDEPRRVVVGIEEDGSVSAGALANAFMYDYGMTIDADVSSIENASNEMVEPIIATLTMSSLPWHDEDGGVLEIEFPNSNTQGAIYNEIYDVRRNPDELAQYIPGPAIVQIDNTPPGYVRIPANRTDVVVETKDFLRQGGQQ